MKVPVDLHAPQNAPAPQSLQVQRLAYSIEETAALLGISRSYLFELIKGGEITLVKLGRRSLVTSEQITLLLANHLKKAL